MKSGLESDTACMNTVRGNFSSYYHMTGGKEAQALTKKKKKRDPLDIKCLELQLKFK